MQQDEDEKQAKKEKRKEKKRQKREEGKLIEGIEIEIEPSLESMMGFGGFGDAKK